MIFKVFQSSLHNTRRWEDANLEKKKGIRNLKYTKKKCASNYMSLKRFEVPLVLMAMIYILFHICVFIEIVKLFHGHIQVKFCSLKLLATHKEFQCVRHPVDNSNLLVICKNPNPFVAS
jgi:hypothetical protein